MDERREKQMIQQAFEVSLSGLRDDPWLAQRVLNEAKKGGKVVMKKKLSVALMIAIVLVLFSAVAAAAALMWQDYVPQVKQAEHELGDYVHWPNAQRIKLANDLLSMGYGHESAAAAVLMREDATEEEKALAADQMMLELTGLHDVEEIHSTYLTYAIMGPEDTWTPEQRVWWHGIITMYGDDGAADTLMAPADEDLSEKEAMAIAKAALAEAYGFDDAYMASLHPVADLYVTDERPNYKRWSIQWKRYREGSTTYVEKIYTVIVDKNFEAQGNHFFWCWPYDVKAAYSEEMIPLTSNLESLRDGVDKTLVYRYGVPTQDNLQRDQALQLVKHAVCDLYGLFSEEIEQYSIVYDAFDITDQQAPKWKFVLINPDDWYGTYYRVHLDASTVGDHAS